MKRISALLLLSLFISSILISQVRSVAEALMVAQQLQRTSTNTLQKTPAASNAVQLTHIERVAAVNSDSITTYYVFNKSDNNGFVIVSADERTKPILAYSTEGSFNTSSLPQTLKYWLNVYNNEILSIKPTDKKLTTTINYTESTNNTSFATTIAPLLGNIKWNQGDPYNNLCPLIPPANTTRSVSGCVATGMAQVMMFHKWPVSGTGSNTYTSTTNNISLTQSFAGTNYNWSNMTDTYSTASTEAQKTAVATLIYHCGVAVSMDYGTTSSASTLAMANALKNNFGYDSNLQQFQRNYYTRTEWKNMLKAELNTLKPILYSGNSNDGGHLFVCDGYDANDLFHFNWGWGGQSNGYFQLSALDPSSQGIGGSSDGFNASQEILIGIQKPTNTSIASYQLFTNDTLAYSTKVVKRNGTFAINASKVYNKGISTFSGNIAMALYSTNNVFLGTIGTTKSIADLRTYYSYSPLIYSNISIPSTYAAGNYKIYMVYGGSGQSNWQIMRGPVGIPNYINATVTATQVLLATPTNEVPKLILNSFTKNGNLYPNKTGRFSVSVTNNGAEYNSTLSIYLESFDNQTTNQLVSTEAINIAAGETRNVEFQGNITMTQGKYYLSVMYDPSNNPTKSTTIEQLGNYQLVDIITAPTETPVLLLNSAISFPNASKVERNQATLTANIKNTIGFYDKKIIAFIFETTGGGSLTYLGYQDAFIDANESRTFTFSGELNLPLKNYNIAVYYQNTSNSWTALTPSNYYKATFTLVDTPTVLENINVNKNLIIYPNPAVNQLTISTTDQILKLNITDVLGRQVYELKNEKSDNININVSNLRTGNYILKVLTTDGLQVTKFNKI
ncbi:MAG: C10 family peptidase [Paludibacter sp.]